MAIKAVIAGSASNRVIGIEANDCVIARCPDRHLGHYLSFGQDRAILEAECLDVIVSKADIVFELASNCQRVARACKAYDQVVVDPTEAEICARNANTEFNNIVIIEILVADRFLDPILARANAKNIRVAAIAAAHDIVARARLETVFQRETGNRVIASGRLRSDRALVELLPCPHLAISELDTLDPAVRNRTEHPGVKVIILIAKGYGVAPAADNQDQIIATRAKCHIGGSDPGTKTQGIRRGVDSDKTGAQNELIIVIQDVVPVPKAKQIGIGVPAA